MIDKEIKEDKKAPTLDITFTSPLSKGETSDFPEDFVGSPPKNPGHVDHHEVQGLLR